VAIEASAPQMQTSTMKICDQRLCVFIASSYRSGVTSSETRRRQHGGDSFTAAGMDRTTDDKTGNSHCYFGRFARQLYIFLRFVQVLRKHGERSEVAGIQLAIVEQ